MSEIEFAVLNDEDRVTIQSALKLQELVMKASITPSEETCFGIPVNAGEMSTMKHLLEESEKVESK